MTAKTKATLSAEQAALYPDNRSGQITAATQRAVTQDLIDSSGTLLDVNLFSNNTNSTSPVTGAIVVTGGIGAGMDIWSAGTIHANTFQGPLLATGFATAPTVSPGDSSTNVATTAFVMNAVLSTAGGGSASTAPPLMDGVAYSGVGIAYSREDHVHPTDTSRAPLVSPALTGSPTSPTPAPGDNSTNIATTAFVVSNTPALGSSLPAVDGTASAGVGTTASRIDHVHPTDTSRAPLASPGLTGTPTAPTVSPATDSTTKIATTSFVHSAIAAVSSGVTLVTAGTGLTGGGSGSVTVSVATNGVTNALAAQMGANTIKGNNTAGTANAADLTAAQTMTLLGAAPLASPTFTGTVIAPTVTPGSDNTTKVATTAFVQSAIASVSAGVTSITTTNGLSGSGSGAVTIGITANGIANASLGTMAAHTYKGNNTGSTTTPIDVTAAQLLTDIGAAPLASPTFTGTPASPTPATNDNTTKIATTAYVQGQASSTTPLVDGTAAVGTGTTWARADHVHPTDTSRAPLASPNFSGTPAAPTPTLTDNSTKIATTAFVRAQVPFVSAADYGVSSGASAATNLTGINNAIAAAVALGGCEVWFPAGTINISGALNAITSNSVKLVGQGWGPGNGGTTLSFQNTTGDCIAFTGASFGCGVRNMVITCGGVKKTTGYTIVIKSNASAVDIRDVFITYGFNGIWVSDSSETQITNVELRYLMGTSGVNCFGTVGNGVYGVRIDHLICDNPYTYATRPFKTWAISTAFVQGDIISQNGNLYQCTVAGTSLGSGTGPTGIPGTTGTNAFTTAIVDGTAQWLYIASNALSWVVQDNYAYSLSMVKCALIDGAYGFLMQDGANTGTSYPQWCETFDLECDHSAFGCIQLNSGVGFYADQGWFGSCLAGNGVTLATTFKGDVKLNQPRIMGNWFHGLLISAGPVNTCVSGGAFYLNSVSGSAAEHNIVIGNSATDIIITGAFCGAGPEGSGNAAYGIFGGTGLARVIVNGCVLHGNVTGGTNITSAGTVVAVNNVT